MVIPQYAGYGTGISAGQTLSYGGSLVPNAAVPGLLTPTQYGFVSVDWDAFRAASNYDAIHDLIGEAGATPTTANWGSITEQVGGAFAQVGGDAAAGRQPAALQRRRALRDHRPVGVLASDGARCPQSLAVIAGGRRLAFSGRCERGRAATQLRQLAAVGQCRLESHRERHRACRCLAHHDARQPIGDVAWPEHSECRCVAGESGQPGSRALSVRKHGLRLRVLHRPGGLLRCRRVPQGDRGLHDPANDAGDIRRPGAIRRHAGFTRALVSGMP